MPFDAEKTVLATDIDALEQELAKKRRKLEKLKAVQEALAVEPAPGSVIRFSRTVAGGPRKYTFVAFRASATSRGWYLTGRSNALRLLGLTETGNSWEDMLVAIGDSEVQVATQWLNATGPEYDYFLATNSSTVRRTSERQPRLVEKLLSNGTWVQDPYMNKNFLVSNPGSFKPISADEFHRRHP